jgi:hypothetical protein
VCPGQGSSDVTAQASLENRCGVPAACPIGSRRCLTSRPGFRFSSPVARDEGQVMYISGHRECALREFAALTARRRDLQRLVSGGMAKVTGQSVQRVVPHGTVP